MVMFRNSSLDLVWNKEWILLFCSNNFFPFFSFNLNESRMNRKWISPIMILKLNFNFLLCAELYYLLSQDVKV